MEQLQKEAVVHFLTAHNVPIETWGTGSAKTLEHLLRELHAKESRLYVLKGMVIREAEGVLVDVYHWRNSELLKLFEEKQIFADGRVKTRDTGGSIGEKISLCRLYRR